MLQSLRDSTRATIGGLVRNGARPRKQDRNRSTPSSGPAEHKQSKLHRDLAQFEDYQTILGFIRKDIKAGLTAKQLQVKYAALAQARVISEMLTNADGGKAIAAAKDLLDRVDGKATEKKEVSHRFAEMSDKELDAVLKSEEADLEDMQERFDQ